MNKNDKEITKNMVHVIDDYIETIHETRRLLNIKEKEAKSFREFFEKQIRGKNGSEL